MKTPLSTDLGTLFFGAYRQQVLGLLLLHPDEFFHLREIARITRTQPGTLRRELALLAGAGVLSHERVGNLVRYRANTSCPIYEELRGILKKTSGVADVLRSALAPLSGRTSAAFIYGSVSRGSERQASDVDVMVIGDVTFEEVVAALHGSQVDLRREINPSVFNRAEFVRNAKKKGSFLARVLAEPRIFVLGSDDELGQLAKNWKDPEA